MLGPDRADGSASAKPGRRGTVMAIAAAMRPHQWIKNCVIFAALLFSRSFTETAMLGRAVMAFWLFCAVSSAVYILNDILDLANDRAHPTKRLRPIAAGELSRPLAAVVGSALAVAALVLSFRLAPSFGAMTAIYLGVNLLYSVWLKRVVIVDVMVISSGFVIRAVAGGLAIGVTISAWLILCTIFLSLFLGFTKRRQELALLESRVATTRAILREYSIGFLDQMIAIVTSATLVAYFLYTLAPETRQRLGTPYMPLTIPFVLYGVFRYLYLVHQKNLGESPTGALYADRPLLINVVLWALAAVAALTLSHG